jgi:hypothetical protein
MLHLISNDIRPFHCPRESTPVTWNSDTIPAIICLKEIRKNPVRNDDPILNKGDFNEKPLLYH